MKKLWTKQNQEAKQCIITNIFAIIAKFRYDSDFFFNKINNDKKKLIIIKMKIKTFF